MQRLLRWTCLGYVVLLSVLLIAPSPSAVIGCHGSLPRFLQVLMPWAHLLSFAVLAVVALAPRWPMPRWSIVLMLAAYGGLTEIVQAFIPPRTPDWADWFDDLCGLTLGVACCWAVVILIERTPLFRRLRAITHTPAA